MTVILERNEVADDRVLQFATLAVRKQGKTARVLKSRYSNRKVLRPEEITTHAETSRKALAVKALIK